MKILNRYALSKFLLATTLILITTACSDTSGEEVDLPVEAKPTEAEEVLSPEEADQGTPANEGVAPDDGPPIDIASLSGGIVFASDRDDNWELYLLELNSGEISRLTEHENTDWAPSVSPDGTKILFASDRDGLFVEGPTGLRGFQIFQINLDGSGLMKLTSDASFHGSAAWSPDGAQISLDTDASGTVEVHLMTASGGASSQLTESESTTGGAAWSPDGSQLVFSSFVEGNFDLFLMDPDGSNHGQLTTDTRDDRFASWSPDGNQLAFTSQRDGNREIYLLNLSDGQLTRLTFHDETDERPEWSPNGNYIVYASERDGDKELFIMRSDGSGKTQLTDNSARDSYPVWFEVP